MPQCKILFKYLTLLALSIFAVNCASKNTGISQKKAPVRPAENAVNINTADLFELKRIPFVGNKNAHKIILYRNKFGQFRRIEHLMLVDGIGEKRFRKIRKMIRVR